MPGGLGQRRLRRRSTVIGRSISTLIDSLWRDLDRHADAGRADVDASVAHDLLRLVDHLDLFLAVAVRAERPVEGDDIAGELGRWAVGAGTLALGHAPACASNSISPFAPLPDDAW